MRRMRAPVAIDVGQTSLDPIRMGRPAQQMIKAAVLHHDNDYMLNPREFGQRQFWSFVVIVLFSIQCKCRQACCRCDKRASGNACEAAKETSTINLHCYPPTT